MNRNIKTELVGRRDLTNGRFSVRNLTRLCKCGHPFGIHCDAWPHNCLSGQNDDAPDTCDCQKFVGARVRKEKV